MIRRPPRSTRTDTLFPYTTLFRSQKARGARVALLSDRSGACCVERSCLPISFPATRRDDTCGKHVRHRSEEHTSELQSLMRNSYAVLCLKKKKDNTNVHTQCYRHGRQQ